MHIANLMQVSATRRQISGYNYKKQIAKAGIRMLASFSSYLIAFTVTLTVAGFAAPASAQSEGGLYIAGYGFSFQEVAERAIAQNSGGRRFFLLSLPEEASALRVHAARPLVAARDRVLAANGVLLVCQRDIDEGRIDANGLAPGVVAVRGWPAEGSSPTLALGERYFKGEDPATLPASNTALRRLRSTCS